MSGQYFGTDGIRGTVGDSVINADFAERLGRALGVHLINRDGFTPASTSVLIGRDTRESGKILEDGLVKGLVRSGINVRLLGIAPTPTVSFLMARSEAELGIVLTASHNPSSDNGFKLLSYRGGKLSESDEEEIESHLDNAVNLPDSPSFGKVRTVAGMNDYTGFLTRLLPAGCLKGWKIAVDCAHGSTVHTTPRVLRNLGAEIIAVGCQPDGRNINALCGSEHPNVLARFVTQEKACLGIAHDGDGDRVVLIDEKGEPVNGDALLSLLASHLSRKKELKRNTMVATVMSNLGLDQRIRALGGEVLRTPVGDRHVAVRMVEEGLNFGGESSGHILFHDLLPSGDGAVAALKVLEAMLESGLSLSELKSDFVPYAQKRIDLPVVNKVPFSERPGFEEELLRLERSLEPDGRILVRYSGTESKVRLMAECLDPDRAEQALAELVNSARRFLSIKE